MVSEVAACMCGQLGVAVRWPRCGATAQSAPRRVSSGRGQIADIFSQVGDQIYEDCIFELSQEQLEVQQALIDAYIEQGASSAVARQFAVKQIRAPQAVRRLRADQDRRKPAAARPGRPTPSAEKKPRVVAAAPKAKPERPPEPAAATLANKKVLPQWDCAPNVDFVTIQPQRLSSAS